MIILRMRDGLGNQMFRYAYARYLQEYYKEVIEINNWDFFFDERKCTDRSYSLSHFVLNKNVRVASKILMGIHTLFMNQKKDRLIKRLGYDQIRGQKNFEKASELGLFVSNDNFTVYPPLQCSCRYKYVDGWFQSYSYCNEIRKILKREFSVQTKPSAENRHMIREIRNCESVCVHIRLGDYVHDKYKKTFYVCTPDYYYSAMKKICEKIKNPVFYIFSSGKKDIDNIKKNYFFPVAVHYVDIDNPDYEDLRLMQNCKHFIIANSSYSWWAQFLADNRNKVVIAPNRWRNHPEREGLNTDGIYDPNWQLIEV